MLPMIGRVHGPGGNFWCTLVVTLNILFTNFRICVRKRMKLVENKRKGKNDKLGCSMRKMYIEGKSKW